MKRRVTIAPAMTLLLLSSVWACQRTAEGVKDDTLAATASASEQAERAKQELQVKMDAFKAETTAQLDRLSGSLSTLEAETNAGIDDSRKKLSLELEETKAKLGQLQAKSGTELDQAKSDLAARISDLGKRLNESVHTAGDKVEKAVD